MNIPITVKDEVGMINTVADRVAADEAHATAHDRKLNREVSRQKAETEDAEWKRISKIPESSSDLIVITKVKKLGAYVIAATENRRQNIAEYLLTECRIIVWMRFRIC